VPCDEPLWLDWRGDLQNDRLTFFRLVAALLGLNALDDLVRRDQERERAARRLRRRISVGVSVLALLAAAAAVVAFEQRQNALEVQSTQLAREAGNQSQAFDNAAAATLALAALPAGRGIVLPRRSTAIAERALVSALSLNRLRAVFHHEGPVSTVRFNHRGTRLITSSGDSSAAILDVKTWKLVVRLRHQQGVASGVFSADDRFVATACNDGSAAVWNADNGSLVANLTSHLYAVTYVEFSPDRRRVLTTSAGVPVTTDCASWLNCAVVRPSPFTWPKSAMSRPLSAIQTRAVPSKDVVSILRPSLLNQAFEISNT
jgi:hypothetical protein